jgi:hypothetical protein
MNASFDVITMGRTGVDIYPLQTGVPLERVESFGKFLGGSATNVAVASARLGRSTAVITRTGQDPFGRYVHEALKRFGVDDRWVSPVAGQPTPVTFCEIFPPDDFATATPCSCPTAGTVPPSPHPDTTCTTSTSWPALAWTAPGSSATTPTLACPSTPPPTAAATTPESGLRKETRTR